MYLQSDTGIKDGVLVNDLLDIHRNVVHPLGRLFEIGSYYRTAATVIYETGFTDKERHRLNCLAPGNAFHGTNSVERIARKRDIRIPEQVIRHHFKIELLTTLNRKFHGLTIIDPRAIARTRYEPVLSWKNPGGKGTFLRNCNLNFITQFITILLQVEFDGSVPQLERFPLISDRPENCASGSS